MRWEPREGDGENNQRNENPAAGGIFAPADSETAASGKGVSDCAGQGQNNEADARRIGKEGCPIAPTPNDEGKKRQRPANSKSKILNDVIQKYELRINITEFLKQDMTAEERSLLEALDTIVGSEKIRAQIYPIVERVRTELARNKTAQMTWEPIPLTIYGGALPSGIRSSWVFILRAGAATGAERHPNSHQRMMSFEAAGDLQVRAGLSDRGEEQWQSNLFVSELGAPLERRWISVHRNDWHQVVVPGGSA